MPISDLLDDAISSLQTASSIVGDIEGVINNGVDGVVSFALTTSPLIFNFDFISSGTPSSSIIGYSHILSNTTDTVTPPTTIGGDVIYNPNNTVNKVNTVVSSIDSYAFLPMPQSISASYPKSWENVNVGLSGMFVDDKGKLDAFGGARKRGKYHSDTMVDVASAGAASLGLTGMSVDGSQDEILRLMRHINGKAINDRVKVMFKDLPFRTFSLNYQLFPKNEKDMLNTFTWIKDMKARSAPDLNGTDNNFWSYPKMFKLKIQSGTGVVMIKTLDCVLTDISTDYAPDGIWAQHKDGNPVKINVALSFSETAPAYRSLIESGEVI